MATRKKPEGWQYESQRHSLASRGVKTKELKPRKLPRQKAPSKTEVARSDEPQPKGDQMIMLCEDDDQFGVLFQDEKGEELRLVGTYVDEDGVPSRLILENVDGKRVEKAPNEVHQATEV